MSRLLAPNRGVLPVVTDACFFFLILETLDFCAGIESTIMLTASFSECMTNGSLLVKPRQGLNVSLNKPGAELGIRTVEFKLRFMAYKRFFFIK